MTFSNADLLPRRLSPEGCRTATTQVQAALQQLADQHIAVPAEVGRAAQRLTEVGVQAAAPALPMNRLDNCADSCIAGIGAVIDAHEQALGGDALVPLTPAQQKHVQAVRSLRASVLPDGTSFVRSKYRAQWERMTTLVAALGAPGAKATVEALGLTPAAQRLERLTEMYGAGLGITRVDQVDEDQAAQQIDRWHDAMGDLVLAVRQAFHDGGNSKHATARRLLLAPYDRQAASEREAIGARRRRPEHDDASPTG